MAEERSRGEWLQTASMMALLANLHRDPKKGRPRRPADYFPFPWRRKPSRPDRINVGIGVLRDVFVKKA